MKRLIAISIPTALFFALVAWAFASPIGSSPDEDYHLASVWCGDGIREGLCEPASVSDERKVPAELVQASSCFAFKAHQSASCPEQPASVLLQSNRGNFHDHGYPTVFFSIMGIFASDHLSSSILMMRMFNALLYVALASATFVLLSPSRRGALLWGNLIVLVPLGLFLIPSVNPSSWAITSAATLWAALLGYFEATDRKKKFALGVLAIISMLVGAGARADAAVYGALTLVVVSIIASRRTRSFAISAILPVALLFVAVAFFFTSGQAGAANPGSFDGTASNNSLFALALKNLQLLPQLWVGAFGYIGLGWLDTTMPEIVWVSSVAVFCAVTFRGICAPQWRKGLALSLVAAALVVVPMYILLHDRVTVGAFVQPRYIFPLIITFSGLCLVQFGRDRHSLSRVQLGVVVSLLSVANSVGLHTNIARYVTGLPGGINLDNGIQWWWSLPFGPMWAWIGGSLLFAIALISAALLSPHHNLGQQDVSRPGTAPELEEIHD